jgi:hypothetical protein
VDTIKTNKESSDNLVIANNSMNNKQIGDAVIQDKKRIIQRFPESQVSMNQCCIETV